MVKFLTGYNVKQRTGSTATVLVPGWCSPPSTVHFKNYKYSISTFPPKILYVLCLLLINKDYLGGKIRCQSLYEVQGLEQTE